MSSNSLEARVGAFVLVALAVLAAFVLALGDFGLAKGFTLFADFAYAGNLQAGAPVRVSGLQVGRVRRLQLLDAEAEPPAAVPLPELGRTSGPVVRAELSLEPAAEPLLKEGLRIAVGLQGVVGEAYLELAPGRSNGAPLSAASAVRGVDAPELHRLMLELAALVDSLGTLTRSGDADGGVLGLLAGVLGERRAELSQALGDLTAAAVDARAIVAQVRRALADDALARTLGDARASAAVLRQELPAALAETREVIGRLAVLSASVSRVAGEGELAAIVADARESARNLAALSRDGRAILARVEAGEGTAGALVRDRQVYEDLKELLQDIRRHPWKLLWRD